MFKTIFRPHTLHTDGIGSLAIWRSGASLLWIVFAYMLVTEIFARTPAGYLLPPPSVGADSFEFDIKVYYLEQSIRQRGELDCLIIGDSVVNNGPDPILIERAYQAKTGTPLHCFNFGMSAIFLDTSGPLTAALANRFHPKLLIVILSARDFESSERLPFRHVASIDWAQNNMGQSSLRGWAVNSLYGYRYLLSAQYLTTPSNRARFWESWQVITKEGFSPIHGFGVEREINPPGPIFRVTESGQNGFNQLLDLKQAGINMIIVDAPIRPDYYEAYHDNYFQPYIEHMQRSLGEHAIPFWLTSYLSENIPSDGWYDLQHVNMVGTPMLSTWLGEKLAENYPADFFK